ncbi:hypothetical protein, partial [Lutibacter sp.]|uniref:hypothetical protein n=1 Tax=Lutibacter sp. TaxID=1925666 RepID=UPI0034A097EF
MKIFQISSFNSCCSSFYSSIRCFEGVLRNHFLAIFKVHFYIFFVLLLIGSGWVYSQERTKVKYDVKCNKCGHENPQWIDEDKKGYVLYCNNCGGLGMLTEKIDSDVKTKSENNQSKKTNEPNPSDIPWEVVIGGAAIGAAVVAIRKKLKKSKNNKKENKQKEEEKAGYILQLSTKEFDFSEEKQGNLEVRVIKITETSEKSINAAIQIINPEPALHIQPNRGTTPLQCKLVLKDQPKENQFKITVIANAEGHQYQKDIQINAGGEPKIVFETAPNNKRSLRPDIKRLIALYAQVVDANNKPIDNLTESMVFTPIGDWAEISEP